MPDQFILTPYFLDRRIAGLLPLAESGWQINIASLPEGESQARMAVLYRPLRDLVAEGLAKGSRPVSIAGDCCASLAVLAGLQKGGVEPTLIWLDAHGDFNTWETTPSGFLGGMPLAMLVGRGEQTIAEGIGLRSLPESRVILCDARDLDPGEREAVAGSAVRHVPEVADLLVMPLPDGPLYVHFDVDVLNLADAPAVTYPVSGGPPAATLRQVFERLAATGQVAAVSVSTWNPALDQTGRTRDTVMDLLPALLS